MKTLSENNNQINHNEETINDGLFFRMITAFGGFCYKSLNRCPESERMLAVTLGLTVFIPFLLAIGGSLFMFLKLTENWFVAIPCSLLIGYFVLQIEVTTMNLLKHNPSLENDNASSKKGGVSSLFGLIHGKYIATVIIRLGIAIVLSYTLSHVLALGLFSNRINIHIEEQRETQELKYRESSKTVIDALKTEFQDEPILKNTFAEKQQQNVESLKNLDQNPEQDLAVEENEVISKLKEAINLENVDLESLQVKIKELSDESQRHTDEAAAWFKKADEEDGEPDNYALRKTKYKGFIDKRDASNARAQSKLLEVNAQIKIKQNLENSIGELKKQIIKVQGELSRSSALNKKDLEGIKREALQKRLNEELDNKKSLDEADKARYDEKLQKFYAHNDSIKAEIVIERRNLELKITNLNKQKRSDPLAQHEALNQIIGENKDLAWWKWAVLAFFLALDTAPLLLKSFRPLLVYDYIEKSKFLIAKAKEMRAYDLAIEEIEKQGESREI